MPESIQPALEFYDFVIVFTDKLSMQQQHRLSV